MKTEQVKQVTDKALGQLITALEQGQSATLTRYLAAMARFHRYSFNNVMLIYTQRKDASQVAGFHTWRKLGRFVRKGEKGILILAPMIFQQAEPEKATSDKEKSIVRFKAAYVFDVSQTDGEPLPEFATVQGGPADHLERLKQFVSGRGIALEYSTSIAPARGVSRGGSIALLPNLSPAEEFAVLSHEIAHEMLHHGERREHTNKVIRETEAEAVAFVVCQSIGLETGTAASDYIQLYSGDRETLAASLEVIQQTACEIIVAIRTQPEDQPD
jgi:antirestriction protein ArdC